MRVSADEPRRYQLDISDAAKAEVDQLYLWTGSRSPDSAQRWYIGLSAAFEKLRMFPRRNEALPDQPNVRRMLYGRYKVLYLVIEPTEEEEEGIVRILRVIHGARASDDSENLPQS